MNGRWVTERLLATTSLAALMLATMSGEADAQACTTIGAGGSYNSAGTVPCINVTGAGISITNQAGGNINGTPPASTQGALLVAPAGSLSGGINNSGTIHGHTGIGPSVGIGLEGNVAGGITNSGTVTAHDHAIQMFASATFGGGISNSGTLQATNTAVALSADTFAGGIINSGTGTIFGSGGSGAAVLITSQLFSGGISNAGTITMNTGISDFGLGVSIDGSGDATFAGGITNAGTIGAFRTGIVVQGLTSFSGGIVNTAGHGIASHSCNGVLVKNVANFSGGITNAGTIASATNGNFNVNAITVGTSGVSGAVSTFIGGITNSGTISGFANAIAIANVRTFGGGITNTGTITGARGILVSNASFLGGITNSGSIQGTGGTALDFTAANNAVTIQQTGGTVLGTILFSSHGDTLAGYGTVVGSLTQGNATIAPALSGTGILRIAGNLTQASTSKTVIEVSPAAAALLQVTGTASIAGGLTVVFDPGTYSNKVYTLVHSGTLSGTYAGATMSGSIPGGTQTVTYTATDVDLTLANVPIPVVSTTTGVFGDPANLAVSGFFDADNMVFGHLDEQQFGQGADQVKTALAGAAPIQVAMNGPLQQLAQASGQLSDALAKYGAWVRGVGSFFSADNSGTASGFSASGGGVLAGIDHPFGPVTLGIAAGYSGTNFTQNDGESGDIQTVRAMLYAHYHAAPQIVVDGIAGFAYDRIHTARPITALGTTATESHNGYEENLAVQAGYVMPWQGFTVIPRAGARYLHFSENRFSETGGSGFNLSRGSQNVDSFQPLIGVAALKPFALDNGMRVTPEFTLSYSHELLNPNATLALTTPTAATVPANIVTPAHNVITLGPSATLRMNDSLNLYADYKLSIGVGKSLDHVIFAGARFNW
jgi:outer membrane autotransporter protein